MAIAPEQQRSLDSFSDERFSQVINRLTRMMSGGEDCILFSTGSFPLTQIDFETVQIGPGVCLKDDVLIHITDTYSLNFNNSDNYYDSTAEMDSTDDYYIVISYDYMRSLPGPNCYYRILKDVDISYIDYPEKYIFLGRADIQFNAIAGRYEIYDIYYNDVPRGVERPDAKIFTSAVVDGGEI